MKKLKQLVIYVATLIGLLCLSGCSQKKDIVDFKQFADNFAQTFNSHDATAFANIYDENAVIYQTDLSEPMHGRKNYEKYCFDCFKAFPNIKLEFLTVIYSGDIICLEFHETGSFTGPMATPNGEIPPTGKSFDLKGVSILKVNSEGKVVEDKTYFNQAAFMSQLGLTN